MADTFRWPALALACLLVSLTGVPLVAGGMDGPSSLQQAEETNATATPTPPPRHTNPDTSENSLPQLQGWYAGAMAQVLIDCTEGARAREWGACDTDQDYPEWLEDYVDIARETETDTDDEAATSFDEARDTQKEFNNQTEDFYTTYEQYQEARENGNVRRARELAREATTVADDVNASENELRTQYRVITRTSAANLSRAGETVAAIQANVSDLAAELETEAFIETRLSATAERERISFRNPLVVTGRLRTANGTSLENRTIQLRIKDRTARTTTNATGHYRLRYRPTTMPTGAQSVRVAYVPRQTSIYAASDATVGVRVRQVTPDVSVRSQPTDARFNERVTVTGRVAAAGVGAGEVPVRVTIGERHLGRVRTTADGTFTTMVRLPAGIPGGAQPVRATVVLDDRALARTTGTTTLRVRPTATRLRVNGSQVGESRQLELRGHLQTASGDPVPGQSVTLRLNGTTVTTVSTTAEGQYATRVTVPDSVIPAEASNTTVPVRVRAVYADSGTNLQAAQANATVLVEVPADTESTLPAIIEEGVIGPLAVFLALFPTVDAPWWLLALLMIAALAVLALLERRYGPANRLVSRLPWTGPSENEPARPNPAWENLQPAVTEVSEPTSQTSSIHERVAALVETDPDAAVIVAYTTVREELGTALGVAPEQTHWEFLQACRADSFAPEQLAAIETLVATHERATFAPDGVSPDTAREALETLDVLLEARTTSEEDAA